MKITFISPIFGERGQKSKGLPISAPVSEYLTGLTRQVRPDDEVELIDANKEKFNVDEVEADLFAFSVLTPAAPWIYRQADRLRARGMKVVMGGIHVTALPEEARQHADAVVIGEAERVWKDVLDDFERGNPKPFYHSELPTLEGLPRPVTNLWNTFYLYGYFQTSRGCPYNCSFCSVHQVFGHKVRVRPIKEVVEEVAASKKHFFWGIDDNIWGINVDHSIELYREMSKNIRRKWWFGTGDLVSLDHPRSGELLRYAREAGLTTVLVGWESDNPNSLREYRANRKQCSNRRDAIKRIRDNGIDVVLFIMVGGRQDTPQDIESILKLCDELKVTAHPVMTTPFPGTALYDIYKPHLIPGLDWDWFDGNHVVYRHDDPRMSVEHRENELIRIRAEIFTLPRILERIGQISMKGFPMAHITSWAIQFPQGRAFKQFASENRRVLLERDRILAEHNSHL